MIRAHYHRPHRLRAAIDPLSAGVGIAVAGVNTWLNSINQSHAQMATTTEIVNQWAEQMGNLDRAYFNEINPTCADQRAALNAFDQAWSWLQSAAGCGNGAYGAAGLACIADRKPGGKFDATRANRDPIASDPRLSGQGCDTGAELLLPSLSTGTWAPSGLTAGGVADVATHAINADGGSPQIVAGIPNQIVYIGLAVAALLLMRSK